MDRHLLVLLTALTSVLAEITLKCDTKIIKKIEALWNKSGTPKYILGFTGKLKSYKATSTENNLKVECKTFQVVDGKLQITYDNNRPVSYEATAKEGILTIAGNTNYIVTASNGVLAGYQCDPNGAKISKASVLNAGISVGDDYDEDTLENAEKALTGLGFSLTREYTCLE